MSRRTKKNRSKRRRQRGGLAYTGTAPAPFINAHLAYTGSKGGRRRRTRRRLKGGLAYTEKPSIPYINSHLAYTGKGGNSTYPKYNEGSKQMNWINPSIQTQAGGGWTDGQTTGTVGTPWTYNNWPGQNGPMISGANSYAHNDYNKGDPQTAMVPVSYTHLTLPTKRIV